MRILIDTNVILDVLLKRSPFYETAIEVLKLSARDDIQEFVSASAITDIYYICERLVVLLVVYRISFWYIVRWGYSRLYKK